MFYWLRGPTYNPTVRRSDKCFISLKVNTITYVIWGQKPNRLLTKERSRTSETRYRRRPNNWQGHTRTQKNTYMNNTDSMKTWIQSWWTGSVSIPYIFLVAITSGFIQVACSRVQPRKVTIEKKDQINEYKKKEKTKRRAYQCPSPFIMEYLC